MSLQDILPKDLCEAITRWEFEDEGGILIDEVKFTDEGIYLTFTIRYDHYEIPNQMWQLTVHGVQEESICRSWFTNIDYNDSMELIKQHPSLLAYTDTYSELYFTGIFNDSYMLFADLSKALFLAFPNMPEISKYLIFPDALSGLSEQGYGLFARGPKTVLKIYEQCLAKHEIKCNFVGDVEPSPDDRTLKLLKLGNSYIIGQTFQFERTA